MTDLDRRSLCAMALAAGVTAIPLTAADAAQRPKDKLMDFQEELILAHCRDVAVRASMFMDAHEIEPMLALFTEDLEFVRPSTYPDVSIKGREQFRSVIAKRPAAFISRHLFTNSIADRLNADSVRVRSYFTHYSGTRPQGSEAALPIENALRSVGEYDDLIVRRGQDWLVARRVGRFLFGGI